MNPEQQQHYLSNDIIRDFIREKKSARRWKNFRFLIILIVIGMVLGGVFSQAENGTMMGDANHGYVSLVYLDGMIGPGQDFSARNVLPLLEKAFSDKNAKGVILDINSGGGTPVQAGIIHDAILRLKNKYHKKVIVVGEDMLASGAYYVAVAADKIYVNENGITGSIGVIMKDFGFVDLIKKVGVERRVYTSGANKDRLDPFLPQTPSDVEKIRQVIGEIHTNFKNVVEAGRKGKLKDQSGDLFSGDFWSGPTAVKLGLIDGLGDLSSVLQNEFHVSAYKDYSEQPSFMKNVLSQVSLSLGTMLGQNDVRVMEKL
ncbi:MAG: S49 family peptidase [Gammaproteobacteria bacterium]|nr:S49 family peptidase [Gammaproteobacteria bacterium]